MLLIKFVEDIYDQGEVDLRSVNNIPQKEIIDILNKCWMTHDGMWFFHCLQEFGIEATNKINKSAIKSLSSIEIKRIQSILRFKKNVGNLEEFRLFFAEASKLMIPDFMNVKFSFSEENQMTWEFDQGKCFAYVGVKRLGVIGKYECGPLYRIKCWLKEFKIKYKFDPEIEGCIMPDGGNCTGKIRLYF
jgi:hypothetical protein